MVSNATAHKSLHPARKQHNRRMLSLKSTSGTTVSLKASGAHGECTVTLERKMTEWAKRLATALHSALNRQGQALEGQRAPLSSRLQTAWAPRVVRAEVCRLRPTPCPS